MKISRKLLIALLLIGLLLVLAVGGLLVMRSGRDESHSASTSLPELEYLEAVDTVDQRTDLIIGGTHVAPFRRLSGTAEGGQSNHG